MHFQSLLIKQSLSAIVLFSFIACGNKKAELVSLQKQTKDEIGKLKFDYDLKVSMKAIKSKGSLLLAHPNWGHDRILDLYIKSDTVKFKSSPYMWELQKQIIKLEEKFDSLEFEIKKF